MNIDNAAIFLANSILVGGGFCIIFIVVVFINNLLHKYWKPVKIFTADSWHINPPQGFFPDHDLQKMKDKDPPMGEPVVVRKEQK